MHDDIPDRLQISIILFNCKEDIKTYDEIVNKELEVISFDKIIENKFKEFVKRNGKHLSIFAPNYKAYCGYDTELSKGREIDIYGESGLYEFITLAKENNWKVFDKGINDFIDLSFPKEYSYLDYKKTKTT